ncbi:hypothetical protein PIB30_068388 [Stylosanthes scabra]|uniref:Uncharacterized protein n=1 Tax=Stylosanthes scabra TaxID=79078 RepID=A0ABU6UMU9_9FABA|nr:hypothetical protein [Stylosanthes scabra]
MEEGGGRAAAPARWVAVAPPSAIMVEGRDRCEETLNREKHAVVVGDHDTDAAAVSKLCSASFILCCFSTATKPSHYGFVLVLGKGTVIAIGAAASFLYLL